MNWSFFYTWCIMWRDAKALSFQFGIFSFQIHEWKVCSVRHRKDLKDKYSQYLKGLQCLTTGKISLKDKIRNISQYQTYSLQVERHFLPWHFPVDIARYCCIIRILYRDFKTIFVLGEYCSGRRAFPCMIHNTLVAFATCFEPGAILSHTHTHVLCSHSTGCMCK